MLTIPPPPPCDSLICSLQGFSAIWPELDVTYVVTVQPQLLRMDPECGRATDRCLSWVFSVAGWAQVCRKVQTDGAAYPLRCPSLLSSTWIEKKRVLMEFGETEELNVPRARPRRVRRSQHSHTEAPTAASQRVGLSGLFLATGPKRESYTLRPMNFRSMRRLDSHHTHASRFDTATRGLSVPKAEGASATSCRHGVPLANSCFHASSHLSTCMISPKRPGSAHFISLHSHRRCSRGWESEI